MTSTADVELRQLALNVVSARAGAGAGAAAVAAAAGSAYGDLVRVFSPLIGDLGVEALTGRAVHLAQQEHTWLAPARRRDQVPDQKNEAIGPVIAGLERQDPAVAADAAAMVFALLTGLLVTFIGTSLTTGLLRQAWPDAFFDAGTEERRT